MDYGSIWEELVRDQTTSIVCFLHGTCVFSEPRDDLTQHALEIMRDFGRVIPGSSMGDFTVHDLRDHEGWVVMGHHEAIQTYVDPSEIDYDPAQDATSPIPGLPVGLYGRTKRDMDAKQLKIVHVRDTQTK